MMRRLAIAIDLRAIFHDGLRLRLLFLFDETNVVHVFRVLGWVVEPACLSGELLLHSRPSATPVEPE